MCNEYLLITDNASEYETSVIGIGPPSTGDRYVRAGSGEIRSLTGVPFLTIVHTHGDTQSKVIFF